MHTKPPLHRLPSHGPSRKRSAVCPSLAGLQQRGFLRTPRVPASPTPPPATSALAPLCPRVREPPLASGRLGAGSHLVLTSRGAGGFLRLSETPSPSETKPL